MKTDQEAKLKVQRDAKLQTEQEKIEDKTTCKTESGARDEVESRDQNSRPRDFILKTEASRFYFKNRGLEISF